MAITFRSGDYLHIQKTFISDLRRGDVVVIKSQKPDEQESHYVHRIVGIASLNFITRGDNNPKNDEEPVTEENIVGKVTHFERNGKIHKVWNGQLGMMHARVLHGRLHIVKAIKLILRKPYRMLKKTGIVAKFWRPEIETIYFETQDGPLVKYVHKGKTVASCRPDNNRWWFRRPYDFVIGPLPTSLPSQNGV